MFEIIGHTCSSYLGAVCDTEVQVLESLPTFEEARRTIFTLLEETKREGVWYVRKDNKLLFRAERYKSQDDLSTFIREPFVSEA